MRFTKSIAVIAGLFITCVAPVPLANGDSGTPLTEDQFDGIKGACSEPLNNSVFFTEAAQAAESTIATLCSGAVRDVDPSVLIASILDVAEKLKSQATNANVTWSVDTTSDEIDLESFAQKIIDHIRAFEAVLAGGAPGTAPAGVPSILFTINTIDGPANLALGDTTTKPMSQADCDAAVAQVQASQNCNSYLQEFERIYTSISRFYSSVDAQPAWQALVELDKEWTLFMEKTLDQTPLELLWNGYLFRKKYGDARSLVGPPKSQQILLKPYIALDYLGEAPDGSQLNETVILDVWGIKKWDGRSVPWHQPLGFSVHAAYSDRALVEDWGYGLSIHFTEANTIGVTSFDGEVSVFLSFDLWKNATDTYAEAEERVSQFRMYRDQFEELMGN